MLETSFSEPFDIVWSRDAFMHIPDKPRLFSRLYQLLAPEGRLVITDYAREKRRPRPSSSATSRRPAIRLSNRASTAGSSRPLVLWMSSWTTRRARFVEILERETDQLVANRGRFVANFSEQDLNYLLDRWAMKVRFCRRR